MGTFRFSYPNGRPAGGGDVCNDEESDIRFSQNRGVHHRNRTCKNGHDMLIRYGSKPLWR
ncbi:hypothetical protein FWK35_00006759 [Aphis craccivora]|uniref:Uncharacterized protein n=1 Tax=Aphis craccivora TaxID=307492 RepID=A0A6G0ZF80_APHCR|nr:hypothetical protein FWK35_00006759 [Aphis craccivora]